MFWYARIKVYLLFVLTVYLNFIEGAKLPVPAQTILEVLEGAQAELPCPVVNISSNSAMTLILWQKIEPGSLQPIYTIDARRQSTLRHFPASELKGRAHFDLASAILYVDKIVASDAGLYKCRVEFRRARTRTYSVLLKVIVPPREAVIMDEFGQHLRGIIGPYDEGFPLILACEAEGGDPSPSVVWLSQDQVLDASYSLTAQGFARNELTIPELTRQDLLTNLTCRVQNSELASPVFSSVILDINLSPTEVRITSMRSPLKTGTETEIVCVARGARPPARVTWWITKINGSDHKSVTQLKEKISDSSSRDDNLTVSTLAFVPKSNDHGAELSCRADNPLKQDSNFIQDNWTLHVRYAPRVRAFISPSNLVQEDSSVTLTCQVKANPPANEVEWLIGGRAFEKWTRENFLIASNTFDSHDHVDDLNIPNDLKTTVESDGDEMEENRTLNIASVDPLHAGNFRCAATNSEGRTLSAGLKLDVQYRPRCVSPSSAVYVTGQEMIFNIAKNETATVVCAVEANPPDVQFEWTLNGSPISPVNIRYANISSANTRTNLINNKRRESVVLLQESSVTMEYGLLECLAVNILGRQKEPCIFRIVPSGPPEPLQQCVVLHNATTLCLNVDCESPPLSLNRRTRMEVISDKGKLLAEIRNDPVAQPSFEACSLPSGTAVLLLIYVEGTDGQYSVPLAIKTEIPFTQLTSATPTVEQRDAFLIGIVTALIVIVCITTITITGLIIILRRRTRNRQDTHLPSDDDKNETKDTISSTKGPDIIPIKGYLRDQEVQLHGLKDISIEDEGPSTVTLSSYNPQFCWSYTEVSNSDVRTVSVDLLRGGEEQTEEVKVAECETPLVACLPQVAQQWSEEGLRLSTPV